MKQSDIKNLLKQEKSFFLMSPALVWQVLFFCIPLAIIISLSFIGNNGQFGITLSHYKTIFNNAHLRILIRSLIFALCNVCICLLIAYPVAYFLARIVKRWKKLLLFLLILPFWTNILVQIYAWFFVLESNGLFNTFLLKLGIISNPLHLLNNMKAVFLVMIFCYLPFMIIPLYNILETIDQRLIESSYDLGANRWQTFFKITLPLSSPGIKTGFFLVFVPSFGEFVIPALMGGSKTMFVGSLISHYFLTSHNASVGAAFTCVSGIVLLVVGFICNWCLSKKANFLKGV